MEKVFTPSVFEENVFKLTCRGNIGSRLSIWTLLGFRRWLIIQGNDVERGSCLP
jgi:hypothetical protein